MPFKLDKSRKRGEGATESLWDWLRSGDGICSSSFPRDALGAGEVPGLKGVVQLCGGEIHSRVVTKTLCLAQEAPHLGRDRESIPMAHLQTSQPGQTLF